MDADRMKAFAAEFDPQPFHLDEAAAERSIFRGLAASGWHTAAATMRLMVESLPFAGGMAGPRGLLARASPKPPRGTPVGGNTTHIINTSRSQSNPRLFDLRNPTLTYKHRTHTAI